MPTTSGDTKGGAWIRQAVAGGVAGLLSRFVIAPLDVIKIRYQLQNDVRSLERASSGATFPVHRKYAGLWNTARLIAREEGWAALWKGNIAASYLYVSYGAIQFTVYQQMKKTWKSDFLPVVRDGVCGGMAGAIATICTYPMDLLRTRFAAQGQQIIYSSIYDAMSQIQKNEGWLGFYRGLWPSVVQIAPYMGIMFSSYGIIQRFVRQHSEASHVYDGIIGAAAGIISKSAVMPLDVIRKRLQVQGPARVHYVIDDIPNYARKSSILQIGRKIVMEEGVLSLYKGLLPSLVKVAPASAVTFMVYNFTNRVLLEYSVEPSK